MRRICTQARCERGEVVGDPKDAGVRAQVAAIRAKTAAVPNLFEVRKDIAMLAWSVVFAIR